MEIKKAITFNPITTDGKILEYGDSVVFNAEGRCFAGIYRGISNRGAVMFDGVIAGTEVTFNVLPRSIMTIYKAEIKVEEDDADAKAESV
jgi:hypothetical protein